MRKRKRVFQTKEEYEAYLASQAEHQRADQRKTALERRRRRAKNQTARQSRQQNRS